MPLSHLHRVKSVQYEKYTVNNINPPSPHTHTAWQQSFLSWSIACKPIGFRFGTTITLFTKHKIGRRNLEHLNTTYLCVNVPISVKLAHTHTHTHTHTLSRKEHDTISTHLKKPFTPELLPKRVSEVVHLARCYCLHSQLQLRVYR